MAKRRQLQPSQWSAVGVGNQINFHQLFIFHVAASHLNFSRAAEALDITQPAVSIQIQELEKSLGVTLFHRRPRGLRITDVGQTVYAYSQRIFSLSSKMVATVQEMQDLKTGHLILGASTTPGEYVLPMAVGQFRRMYPGVRVELVIAKTRSIIQRILNREMDLGMVGDRDQGHSDELDMVDYVDDEIVLVVAPDHPIAGRQPVTPAEVVVQGLIVREEGSATRQTAERHFRALGADPQGKIGTGQQPNGKAGGRGRWRCRSNITARGRCRVKSRNADSAGCAGMELSLSPDLDPPKRQVPISSPKGIPPVLVNPPTGHRFGWLEHFNEQIRFAQAASDQQRST